MTSKDVRRISKAGKLAAMIGVENGYPIGTDLSRIKYFAERGARYMSLAHNGHSQLADSNTGERDNVWLHNGLSELGKKAIVEMNKWGIIIDISHPSKQANMQAIQLSKAPVIASHSGARALCDHSRNLDDEQLELIKKNGGVVQAVAFRGYVSKEKSELRQKMTGEILRELAAKENFKILERADVLKMPETERAEYGAKLTAFRAKMRPVINERLKDYSARRQRSGFRQPHRLSGEENRHRPRRHQFGFRRRRRCRRLGRRFAKRLTSRSNSSVAAIPKNKSKNSGAETFCAFSTKCRKLGGRCGKQVRIQIVEKSFQSGATEKSSLDLFNYFPDWINCGREINAKCKINLKRKAARG